MNVCEEPRERIGWVAERTGESPGFVADVLRDLHYVIDGAVSSDINVLMGPLYFSRRDNPVVPAIASHFTDEDWRNPEGLKTAMPEELADALRLPLDVVIEHPCFFSAHILVMLANHRRIAEGDHTGFERLDRVQAAWRDHMQEFGVTYRVAPAGRERDFETWLVSNLDALARVDVPPVTLVARQPRLAGGRWIPDLLCRFTTDSDLAYAGDLLLIENKATPVDISAWHQLRQYRTLTVKEVASKGQGVVSMLIADGTTVDLSETLRDEGVLYGSLSELGYRRYRYDRELKAQEFDSTRGTDVSASYPVALHVSDRDRRGSTPTVPSG